MDPMHAWKKRLFRSFKERDVLAQQLWLSSVEECCRECLTELCMDVSQVLDARDTLL